MKLKSAIYTGMIHHSRTLPKFHDFRYHVAFFYLDLAEIKQIFNIPILFSYNFPRIFGFNRARYLAGEPSLDESVRSLVTQRTGRRPEGAIRLLTQISYFGFCFNPVSFYYCFNKDDTALEFLVAEITNTPWNERKRYVFECKKDSTRHQFEFKKDFHVSPFLPMDLDYVWAFHTPNPENRDNLKVMMEDFIPTSKNRIFFANLSLKAIPMTRLNLFRAVLGYPFMTFKTFLAIYYQAMLLILKRIPFFSHPKTEVKL